MTPGGEKGLAGHKTPLKSHTEKKQRTGCPQMNTKRGSGHHKESPTPQGEMAPLPSSHTVKTALGTFRYPLRMKRLPTPLGREREGETKVKKNVPSSSPSEGGKEKKKKEISLLLLRKGGRGKTGDRRSHLPLNLVRGGGRGKGKPFILWQGGEKGGKQRSITLLPTHIVGGEKRTTSDGGGGGTRIEGFFPRKEKGAIFFFLLEERKKK